MANFLIGLFALAVVVTVVTVIGHGLWMTAAAISRLVFGTGENGQPGTSHCTRCGHPTGLKNGTCVYCGFETVAAQRRGLKSAIRQIQQMRDQDRLEPTICDHAIQALSAAEQQLRSPQDPSEARRQRSVLSALHDAVTTPPSQPAVPASPAASPQTPAAWQELADAATEPIEAELVADDDAVQVVRPAAAATMPATVPDFARDTEAAPTAFSPRRTLADMLQSFMEEKNIRWGELASGMLIVGSAIGLVISLRATLAEISERIRYFPALLFLLGTVAIHAAGLYTLRRWKLRSTSRGVLIIATLLVPLSFAAGILLSGSDAERSPVTSPLYISAVAAGLLGYGAITSLSARSLFAEGWWRLVVAVMGTSAGQLIINRLAEAENTRSSVVTATALFALPLASFLVATLAQLQLVARKTHLTRARSAQTFTVLGIAAFALVVPLGLLLYRCGAIRETLDGAKSVIESGRSGRDGHRHRGALALRVAAVGRDAHGRHSSSGFGWSPHGRCDDPGLAVTRRVDRRIGGHGHRIRSPGPCRTSGSSARRCGRGGYLSLPVDLPACERAVGRPAEQCGLSRGPAHGPQCSGAVARRSGPRGRRRLVSAQESGLGRLDVPGVGRRDRCRVDGD